uniref:T-complex protein 1 subunit delta n=2 Tax=Hemiselmis andersenii TaxID=464988 RepID=A0A7S0Y676_HEMAN
MGEGEGGTQLDTGKRQQDDVRTSNIMAGKAISDAVRTSLGPRGMDKMMETQSGEVIITNDGATILRHMSVSHPAAKMMVELSKSQDIEAGDGTTSVVVLAGGLLNAVQTLLTRGLHPNQISDAFQLANNKADEIMRNMAIPVDFSDKETLVKCTTTSLCSKVVSQNSSLLAPLAVDAVMSIADPATETNADLNNIKVVQKLGGTVDDTELIQGLVFSQKISKAAGGPMRMPNAKIAVVQFCLSPPKTDIENSVVISDYQQMDRLLKEERNYIADLCKKIAKTGCNVVLLQKSILRDAITDLGLHFLSKLKIMLIRDIERDQIEFICKTLNCTPIASADALRPEKLGKADMVEEIATSDGKIVKITGVPKPCKTASILCRGSNKMMLEENERSIHDALCVVRSLFKQRYLIPGGSAPEMEVSHKLMEYAKTLSGADSFCVRAYAEALEIVPATLAENAGLNPISIVTELRQKHARGEQYAGVNVRKGTISNMNEENVVQPLLVSSSALSLATECVRMLLKIDGIVPVAM